MKKSYLCHRVQALLCGLLMLAGCQSQPAVTTPTVRIGVSLYRQDDTFIHSWAQNLEQLAKTAEREQNIKINLNITDSRSSQAAQNEQVDRFLSHGYDVICVNIVDRTAAAVIVDKAQAANVPVIFFNREPVEEDIMRWEKAYYVGTDAAQAGQRQGELVLAGWQQEQEVMDRNGDGILQYAILEGEPGHQDALLRTEYCTKALERAGVPMEKLANNTANWQRGQAAAVVKQWQEQFGNDIEAVFCNNDDMALGAIDAYLAAGVAADYLPFVVGVDATPPAIEAVTDGTLQGTVVNDSPGQAQSVLQLACILANSGDPTQSMTLERDRYIRLPGNTVTAKSLAEQEKP